EGHRLYNCDECPRAICSRCMKIHTSCAGDLEEPDVRFRCVLCHIKLTQRSKDSTPYF
ncbi:hypothetical protein P692DRAFT_20660147, partial [Suillus brevipes Sb2]